MRPALLAVLALVVACRKGEGQESGFSTSITTVPHDTSSGGDSSTSSTSSTSAAEDSDAGNPASSAGTSGSTSSGSMDLGTPPDFGGPPEGCKGKIDFVFAIGSQKTMKVLQDRLKTSFPGFIQILESEFADFDYHIISPYPSPVGPGFPWCKDCVDTCPDAPPDYPCGAQLEPCDSVMGAGITFPIGWDASNERCELASGRRYITTGEPMLLDAFTCIATVGTTGTNTTARATVKAITDEINGPGGCNEDFLRDDALLVVVAIQDSYDSFSEGTPQDWADALVAAKGGDGDAVVLLVISTDIDDPDSLCGYQPADEHKLRTWTELMPHGLFRSACVDDYAPYFAEAAATIKAQCDVFVPK